MRVLGTYDHGRLCPSALSGPEAAARPDALSSCARELPAAALADIPARGRSRMPRLRPPPPPDHRTLNTHSSALAGSDTVPVEA